MFLPLVGLWRLQIPASCLSLKSRYNSLHVHRKVWTCAVYICRCNAASIYFLNCWTAISHQEPSKIYLGQQESASCLKVSIQPLLCFKKFSCCLEAPYSKERRRSRGVRDVRLSCRKSPEDREIEPGLRHPTTGKLSLPTSSKWVPFSIKGRIRQ